MASLHEHCSLVFSKIIYFSYFWFLCICLMRNMLQYKKYVDIKTGRFIRCSHCFKFALCLLRGRRIYCSQCYVLPKSVVPSPIFAFPSIPCGSVTLLPLRDYKECYNCLLYHHVVEKKNVFRIVLLVRMISSSIVSWSLFHTRCFCSL